eukprot:TRINITY_DN82893_c0_g1_i1.p1 TRINITY_DN82893_c0_g1~~TRINITY_DN82893_c0_g1_i1.p1  ORF type:complete len:294 (+),score=44.06 TRINITY_DN82893_c0_g1_i1:80-961(+)
MAAPSQDGVSESSLEPGPVSLVGAGPGDPELLTVKAVRRLEAAEIVLHDNLISDEVLALIPKGAEIINVGKRCGDIKDRGLQQKEIHDLMILHSRRGRRVVRLKCGDPFVFGRGGEELEVLVKHQVPVEIVPGITSALGAAASCQVPLTHRGFNTNHVHLCVGQSKAYTLPDMDWAVLAKNAMKQTAVFYMGLKSLSSICKVLRENGAPDETPMVLIESATTPCEETLYGTLSSMPEEVVKQQFGRGGPVLIILGPTAAFPAHLEKLNGRPLKRARVGGRIGDASMSADADVC